MRATIQSFQKKKLRGEKIAMVTAYDYTSAKILESAGIDLLLVGDSLGQVVLGHDSTVPVTMDEMVHHVRAVVRGTSTAHVVADMPFMSYQANRSEAVGNAGRLLKEGGAQSVKLEGGVRVAETVSRIVEAGIPVMGHVGLTPQSVHQLGGYRVQGRSKEAGDRLMEDVDALREAGVYAVVLELLPTMLAADITRMESVLTIGIGAGPYCHGQVQVFHDMMGLFTDFVPKHARRYASLAETIKDAASAYALDVRNGSFPSARESFDPLEQEQGEGESQ